MSVLHSILAANPTSEEWRLYLTFRGGNDDNLSGWSEKFWEISHAAGSHETTVRWGKIGSYGQSMTCPVSKGLKTALEKVSKGYKESPTRCKHQSMNTVSKATLVAKAQSKGFPYDQTVSAVSANNGISLLDAEGDVIVTLTADGVKQFLAA